MYDAADFLEEILETDRVQHYGMTRTVRVGKDEKISDAAEKLLPEPTCSFDGGCVYKHPKLDPSNYKPPSVVMKELKDRAAGNALGRGGRGEREGHLSQDDDQ
jgi:hypothetical protein